jgi:cell division septation protein DedD
MSRIVRIIVWAIILFAFYFFISTVVKSCGSSENKAQLTDEDTEMLDDNFEDTGGDYFEDSEDDFEGTGEEDSREDSSEDSASQDKEQETFEEPVASSAVEKPASEKAPSKINVEKPNPPSNTVSSSSGKYLVVTGSFLMKENADKMIRKLKKMGYSNAGMIIFEASQYHTVTSGRYASRSDANSVVQSLKAAGIDCYSHRIK